ncbi:S1/P1 nuclease [Polynucleobacter sp. Ross1-W9]|uniref:S1/P1 nuclease n=1 Tax=Polynucleobacter parvulilacunae TaxID=1855631 RepID=UPI001C0D93C9|nr:S1/P1 nuclease [Polynucleobacter parvulilacunae]MBU3557837.1 S1/P1 nuclease [Polynucleobacter parvulilacunae]
MPTVSQYKKLVLSIGVVVGALSTSALAWGPTGHQTTGYIAQSLLTPEVQIRLNEIMPAADLGQVATWMDDERLNLKKTIPDSAQWHFYNLPVCDNKPKKDLCKNNNCAIYRIDEYSQVLADPKASKEDKIFAVRVIVHVVGDLHQPLHAGDNGDRGGNQLKVGEHTNLHSTWDKAYVQKMARGKTSKEFAQEIRDRNADKIEIWQAGDALNWANESNQAARSVAYGQLPNFSCDVVYLHVDSPSKSYEYKAQKVIEQRLAMAGSRIAFVLNTALKKPKTVQSTEAK